MLRMTLATVLLDTKGNDAVSQLKKVWLHFNRVYSQMLRGTAKKVLIR